VFTLSNPAQMPDPQHIKQIREPTVHATIITPVEYVGNLLTLCNECRGVQVCVCVS
jgi:GTP-binding protein LepA